MATQSGIERLIAELEDYVNSCKNQPLSNTKIIVNKDEIMQIITDLKTKTPEELSRYQKVVSNQQAILKDAEMKRDAIIKDAKEKAEKLISDVATQTNEMVNENSIMKQAYEKADQVVKAAYAEAQNRVDAAAYEANEYRNASVDYMDGMLAAYENLLNDTLRLTQNHIEGFYNRLHEYHDIVVSNRMELYPPQVDPSEVEGLEAEAAGDLSGTGQIGNVTGNIMQNTGNLAASNTGNINVNNSSEAEGVKLM